MNCLSVTRLTLFVWEPVFIQLDIYEYRPTLNMLTLLPPSCHAKLCNFRRCVCVCILHKQMNVQLCNRKSRITMLTCCLCLAYLAPACDAIYSACWTCSNTTEANDPSCSWQYCTNSNVRIHFNLRLTSHMYSVCLILFWQFTTTFGCLCVVWCEKILHVVCHSSR